MFCEKCGSELNEGAEFCSKCGIGAKEKKSKKDIKINKDKVTEISALDKKECWKSTLVVCLWLFAISCMFFAKNSSITFVNMIIVSLVSSSLVSSLYYFGRFSGNKEICCPYCNRTKCVNKTELTNEQEYECNKCENHSIIKDNMLYAIVPEQNKEYKIYNKKGNKSLYIAIIIAILGMIVGGIIVYNNELEREKENLIWQQEEKQDKGYITYNINNSGLFVNSEKISEKTNDYGDLIEYKNKLTLTTVGIDIKYDINGRPTSITNGNEKATIVYNNNKISAVFYFSNDNMVSKKVYSYNKNGDVSLVQIFDGSNNKITNTYEYEYFTERHTEYVKKNEYRIPRNTNIKLYTGYEIYEKKDVIDNGSVYEILNYCPMDYFVDIAVLKTHSNNPSPALSFTYGPIYANIIRKKVEIDYYDADMGYSKRGETTTIYVYDEKDRLVGTYIDDELILKGSLSIYKDSDNVTIRSQFGMYDDVQLQSMNAGENEKYYKRDIKYYYNNGKLTRVEYQEQPTYITFDEYAGKKEEYKKYIDKYYEPTNFEFENVEEKEIEDTATNNKYEGNTNDATKDNSYKENTNTDDTNKDNSYEDNKPIKVEYSAPRFSNPYYSCIAKDTYTVTYTIKDSYDSEIELTVKANGSLVGKETVSVDTKNVFEFSLPDNTNLKSIEILCTNSKGKSVSHTIKVSLADYAPSISGNGYFTMPNGEHIIDYYIYEKNDDNIELKVKVNNELINTETVQTNINNRVKFTMPESEEVKRIELICTNSRGFTDTYVYTQ